MLKQLLIFTRGGLVLWSWGELDSASLKESPVDAFIRSCLLDGRSGHDDAVYRYFADEATYTLKWVFHNDLGLVFVAVYQRVLHLLYVDELLEMVKCEFSKIYDPKRTIYTEFNGTFTRLLKEVHDVEQIKSSEVLKSNSPQITNKKSGKVHVRSGEEDGRNEIHKEPQSDVKKLYNLRPRACKSCGSVPKSLKEKQGKNKLKRKRVSDVMPQTSDLDFIDQVDEATLSDGKKSMMDKDNYTNTETEEKQQVTHSETKEWYSFIFRSIAGKKVFERSDLEPALKVLKEDLMAKNVVEEIAEMLCESVAVSLEGKEIGSFRRIHSTVQAAVEEALLHILAAERAIDILKDVHAAKEQCKPYIIVFVGDNGVGKTTNLAKVAYWLLCNNVSVMMAACDTFWSGAVEQLRTHAHRLKIPLFEKEDEKDPAVVAKEAIQDASQNKLDVVLVDTPDVMQGNEPLMRNLSKLINFNDPDLILFVGEALVGDDAVDHFTKFNQKFADLLTSGTKPRSIDGILLTNFDTIDDKIGPTLSMVYISGVPVMFVGCEESYADLQKLNVKSIAKTLLK